MIGECFRSTGIRLKYGRGGSRQTETGYMDRYGWTASLTFQDAGFCDDDLDAGLISTEGEFYTRYYVGEATGDESSPAAVEALGKALTVAIDVLKRDAEALGIRFGFPDMPPAIYAQGDGEDPEWPMPFGWRALLKEQADRLGWTFHYDLAEEGE